MHVDTNGPEVSESEVDETGSDVIAEGRGGADHASQPLATRELISEEAADSEELDPPVDESIGGVPVVADELEALGQALTSAGFSWELVSPDPRSGDAPVRLRFDFPAGRSSRSVFVDASDARQVVAGGIEKWRSLERYNGVWNGRDGIAEVALRSERMPASVVLKRIVAALGEQTSGSEDDALAAQLVDDESGITICIGEASDFSAVLLTGTRPYRPRPPLTLRIWPVSVNTTEEADLLIERVTDAVSLDLGVSTGASIVPQRLENRSALRRGTPSRRGRVNFPRNRYPHAPVTLYQAGRDHRTSPLIRYWCFYQVLEYFFPTHSEAEAVRQLSRHLKSPRFDAHNEEDVLRAVQLAGSAGRGYGSEEEQLRTTLNAIVTGKEVAEFLAESALEDHLGNRRSELSSKTVNAKSGDDLIPQLSQRIYDVRCRIVHSKSGRSTGDGAGLLPGTHHDDLVRDELALLEFLAQQALVASADRMVLSRR